MERLASCCAHQVVCPTSLRVVRTRCISSLSPASPGPGLGLVQTNLGETGSSGGSPPSSPKFLRARHSHTVAASTHQQSLLSSPVKRLRVPGHMRFMSDQPGVFPEFSQPPENLHDHDLKTFLTKVRFCFFLARCWLLVFSCSASCAVLFWLWWFSEVILLSDET